jgi:hypothetical protein
MVFSPSRHKRRAGERLSTRIKKAPPGNFAISDSHKSHLYYSSKLVRFIVSMCLTHWRILLKQLINMNSILDNSLALW